MKTLTLPNGDRIPAVGLGTWKSKPREVGTAVREALRIGYRHLDCAAVYGNEAEIGAAVAGAIEAGDVTRDALWITSKLWNDAHEPADVRPALERTLADLRLDTLDLYLMHWPIALRRGVIVPESAADLRSLDEVPLADTWSAMEACVDAGLCRHLGVSNFSRPTLSALLDEVRIRPVVNQVERHPYLRQPDLAAWCAREQILITAYSPLGSRDRGAGMKRDDEPSLLDDPVVGAIAAARGASPAQVLIAWAVGHETSVIPKSTDPGRLRENLDAASIVLTGEEMKALDALDRNYRFVHGGFWEVEGGPYTVEGIWGE